MKPTPPGDRTRDDDRPREADALPSVGFVSLGCPKNQVDSEVMLGHLREAGHRLVRDPADAEVVVVNTCAFIDAAREESVETILEAARLKEQGRCRRLVVAGCMVQRYHEDLAREIPEIDAFVGLDELGEIAGRARDTPASAALPAFREDPQAVTPWIAGPSTRLYDATAPRTLAGPPYSAYLKVAEGCDQQCAFCAIPTFRGAFRSRRLGDLQDEARALADAGVRELNLISQDTTSFGRDLGLEDGPAGLLASLAEIDDLRWIRMFYLYPNRVSDALVEAMARLPSVVEYVDMPLQHAHRDTLRRMRRGGHGEGHLRLLDRFRSAMPEVSIRSTFIVGFPGETEEEFHGLVEFVQAAGLDVSGVFTYSHESDTVAGAGGDDVPPELKEERRERLLEAQESVSLDRNLSRVGKRVEVLCEGPAPDDPDRIQGRLRGQAPDVDGRVLLDGDARPGEFVRVLLTGASAQELEGRIENP